jgi:cyclophilin family peptidyl-prolyl cis-trans isomerase
MAKQTIGIGSSANDGTGDPLRTAFNKTNENFTEVYDALRPYKVFTALLSQSGGNSTTSADFDNQQPLIVGATYRINDNSPLESGGTDFTNVGAPNNNTSTFFIATGDTPIWGSSNGIVIGDTGIPIANILENTIGNVWFEYIAQGVYNLNSDGLFLENTLIPNGTNSGPTVFNALIESDGSGYGGKGYFFYRSDSSTVRIGTLSTIETFDNNVLYSTPIEIRVYN